MNLVHEPFITRSGLFTLAVVQIQADKPFILTKSFFRASGSQKSQKNPEIEFLK